MYNRQVSKIMSPKFFMVVVMELESTFTKFT